MDKDYKNPFSSLRSSVKEGNQGISVKKYSTESGAGDLLEPWNYLRSAISRSGLQIPCGR
jgi:hypothetical protein